MKWADVIGKNSADRLAGQKAATSSICKYLSICALQENEDASILNSKADTKNN